MDRFDVVLYSTEEERMMKQPSRAEVVAAFGPAAGKLYDKGQIPAAAAVTHRLMHKNKREVAGRRYEARDKAAKLKGD